MGQSVLSVRMDAATKDAFAAFCEEAGMSVSTAVNLFARQVVRDQRMPFVVSLAGAGNPEGRSSTGSGVLSIDEIAEAVACAARHLDEIRAITLFGSYARGEARPDSDIDLRLECDGALSMFTLGSFVDRVQRATGKDVDVVTASNLGDDRFARAIKREGRRIYERA